MATPAPTTSTPPAERGALRELIGVAAPTVATMASYTFMQFVDGLMVSRIEPASPIYLAAQGNGAVWSFVPMAIFSGLSGVVNTYVSQNLGAGTPERGAAYAWNALWVGLCLWVGALLPLALFMPTIFGWMGHEPDLRALETTYCQILLVGGVVMVINRSLAQFFYGLHKPKVTLVGAIAGNVVNLLASYALIFGHFGLPALGVVGAAWGTLLGTSVEALIPLAVFLSGSFQRRFATRSSWRPSLRHVREIVSIGWPASAMHGNEIICWAIFMSSLSGRFGPASNTAGWIAQRYLHLSFMPAVGISFALTAVVGRCLGAGRPDLAVQRAKLGIALAMGYMTLCALVFILFRHTLVRIWIPDDMLAAQAAEVLLVGAQIMIVAAIFQTFDGLGIALVGILRGAGDTVWPGIATIILSWLFIVGGGAALAFGVPQWKSLGPWIAAGAYIIALGIALGWRFAGGAWKTKRLVPPRPEERGDAVDLAMSPVVEVER